MGRLKYYLLALGAAAIIGCEYPHIKYGQSQISLRDSNPDSSERTLCVRQNIPVSLTLKSLTGKDKIVGEYTVVYEPLEIRFNNSKDMPEIPNPVPILKEWDKKNPQEEAQRGDARRDLSLDPEFVNPSNNFMIPFDIMGKRRVSKETLDSLIASGKVTPVAEYSLGTVVVTFETNKSITFSGSGYRGTAYDRELRMNQDAHSIWKQDFYPTGENAVSKDDVYDGLKQILRDADIKTFADEILWRIAQSKGIETLFEKIEGYEKGNPPITHFAVVQEQNFGLGDSLHSDSKAEGHFLSAEAQSKADTSLKFTIHLSGIIARETKNANR